jgi:hypothetical protein
LRKHQNYWFSTNIIYFPFHHYLAANDSDWKTIAEIPGSARRGLQSFMFFSSTFSVFSNQTAKYLRRPVSNS